MFERNADQDLFAETTRKFLEAECPSPKLRELGSTESGFDSELWRRGAELGWTSLVVPEEAGGGSVSGSGGLDLVVLAYEFGTHAAPGPLQATNLVAAALGRWGSDDQRSGPLASILSGDSIGTWALFEPSPHDGLGQIEMVAEDDGDHVVLNGIKSPVESALHAQHLLVTARHRSGVSHFLVPHDAAGVSIVGLQGVDMTRRFAEVHFDHVRVPIADGLGEPGDGQAALDWLIDLAVVMQLAEMVGTMQWAFDTTLEWAFNRFSFGRPLASYQEIKHRFADMKMWLEGSYAIAASAAKALDEDATDRPAVVSAGKSYIGRNGGELLQDCLQLHGGIGVTFDHDMHLFLRRVTTDIPLYGTPAQHARRICDFLEAKEGTR
jgi:alkylation response protein AidB-like acyl-CoA dehydrogenase